MAKKTTEDDTTKEKVTNNNDGETANKGETTSETGAEVKTVKKPTTKKAATKVKAMSAPGNAVEKEEKEPKNKKLPKGVTLHDYLEHRINARLSQELSNKKLPEKELDLSGEDAVTAFIKTHKLSPDEVVILLLTLIPYLQPNFLDTVLSKFLSKTSTIGDFIEFGSVKGKNYRGIIPTGETALYILAGNNIEERTKYIRFIQSESKLFKEGIISMGKVPLGEPPMSGKLFLDEEYVSLFTTGIVSKPKLSASFPASLIETSLSWEDLILKPETLKEVKEIQTWLQCNDVLLNDWGMKDKIKPGYRVLFYGAPGTGKTLTASLLGKYTEKDVYRVDLSMVVSKFIGETEKNLASLFDKAINKDWILFFDEADSIFGKRTDVRDAHDKYANQEVSYLLQRIEAHPGLIILASNFKNNIDTAFTRRFHSIIEFETPSYEERLRLWETSLPKNVSLEEGILLDNLAEYPITGANIVNVIQFACLQTIAAEENFIKEEFILEGIRREYSKEGKTM